MSFSGASLLGCGGGGGGGGGGGVNAEKIRGQMDNEVLNSSNSMCISH